MYSAYHFVRFNLRGRQLLGFSQVLRHGSLRQFVNVFPTRRIVSHHYFTKSNETERRCGATLIIRRFRRLHLLNQRGYIRAQFGAQVNVGRTSSGQLLMTRVYSNKRPRFGFFTIRPMPSDAKLQFPPFARVRIQGGFRVEGRPLALFC